MCGRRESRGHAWTADTLWRLGRLEGGAADCSVAGTRGAAAAALGWVEPRSVEG